jgi:hypothetical protein
MPFATVFEKEEIPPVVATTTENEENQNPENNVAEEVIGEASSIPTSNWSVG